MTAVEWLKNEMAIKVLRSGRLSKSVLDLFEQAIELEKQQIIDAYKKGYMFGMQNRNPKSEEYYNETYKKNNL
jgi:hypothetical protein